MIELKNCEVHDNTFIEHAVINAVGTVIVDQAQEGTPTPGAPSADAPTPKDPALAPSPLSAPKRGRKKKAPRIVPDTYTYKWKDHREGMLRVIKLYQLLIDDRFRMLDPSTDPDNWVALFQGESKAFTLKWMGRQAHLRYLFKLLLEQGYITHDAQSAGKWEILGSHFVSKAGRPFDQWDKQHDPKKGIKTLHLFADVLNIATQLPDTDSLEADIREELDSFADYESF